MMMLVGGIGQANAFWRCYVNNTYGYSFYGDAATKFQATDIAMYYCRSNTPMGGTCVVAPLCDWF